MGETTNTSAWIGGFILILILFALFNGGMGFGGNRADAAYVKGVSDEILATVQQGNETRSLVAADGGLTRAKIDFYAYEQLRDQLSVARDEIIALKNAGNIEALRAQMAAGFATVPKAPPVYCGHTPYNGCHGVV